MLLRLVPASMWPDGRSSAGVLACPRLLPLPQLQPDLCVHADRGIWRRRMTARKQQIIARGKALRDRMLLRLVLTSFRAYVTVATTSTGAEDGNEQSASAPLPTTIANRAGPRGALGVLTEVLDEDELTELLPMPAPSPSRFRMRGLSLMPASAGGGMLQQ